MTDNPWNRIIQASSGEIRRLTSVWRYSSIPVSVEENTAEHQYWVALYATMFHKEASGSNFPELLGPVILHAIMHDTAECVTGDIVRVFKYSTPELKREIDRAESILVKNLPIEIQSLIDTTESMVTESQQDYVKDIVKAADFLSLFQFMRREAMRSNLEIYPYYNRMIDDIGMMEDTLGNKNHTCQNVNGKAFHISQVYKAMKNEAQKIKSICFPVFEEQDRYSPK